MVLLLAGLLSMPVALAGDGPSLELQGGTLLARDGHTAMTGGVALLGARDSFLTAEGRLAPGGGWLGRVGAGFDLLGGSDLDLRLGLFMGGRGVWPDGQADSQVITGGTLGIGGRLGRLYGQYRWIGGFGATELHSLHTENELTVGFRVVDELRVYGQVLFLDPGDARWGEREQALGLGVAWRL